MRLILDQLISSFRRIADKLSTQESRSPIYKLLGIIHKNANSISGRSVLKQQVQLEHHEPTCCRLLSEF